MTVKRVGIVGSGIMGSGIAEVAAAAGYEVVLRSRAQQSAEAMVASLGKSLAKQVEKEADKAADKLIEEARKAGDALIAEAREGSAKAIDKGGSPAPAKTGKKAR